jgi:L-cystine transport system permease protein
MGFNFVDFEECLQSGLLYLPRTIELAGLSVFFGLFFGTLLATWRVYDIPILGWVSGWAVTLYQGVPVVVALMIFNLLFMAKIETIGSFLHVEWHVAEMDNIWIGIFVLSMRAICLMEESIRGAFYAVERGQYEAGLSVGLTHRQTLWRIILPQMVPVAIPALLNNVVGTIKNSSIVIAIGISEVLTGATIPCSRNYSFLEGYVAAAVIYWVFTVCIEKTFNKWEKQSTLYRRTSL